MGLTTVFVKNTNLGTPGKREPQSGNCLLISDRPVGISGAILLIADHERHQPAMGGAIPGEVGLGYTSKVVEQARGSLVPSQ